MMDPETRATLQAVRELLSDPARWTRRTAARNKRSRIVDPMDVTAVRWCLLGAIERVANFDAARAQAARGTLMQYSGGINPLIDVNDVLGYPAVLALLDRALDEEG